MADLDAGKWLICGENGSYASATIPEAEIEITPEMKLAGPSISPLSRMPVLQPLNRLALELFKREVGVTEEDALREIEAYCRTGDLEGNGSQLDKIIENFLRANGFNRLADAADSVECWRA